MPAHDFRSAAVRAWNDEAHHQWCRELPRLVQTLTTADPSAASDLRLLHQGRNLLFQTGFGGQQVVVKHFGPYGWLRGRIDFRRGSKAQRSFLAATGLLDLGFDTPAPLAWCEWYAGSRLVAAAYISSFLTEGREVRLLLPGRALSTEPVRLDRLGAFVARMHLAGVWHRDLSFGNLLMTGSAEACRFHLVDLNRLRLDVRLPPAAALANLAMLGFPDPESERILAAYCQVRDWPLDRCRTLLARAAARRRLWRAAWGATRSWRRWLRP